MQSELELINSEIKKNIDNLMEVYKTYLREDLPFLLVQWGHMSQLMMDVCRHITRNPEKITTIFQCYQEKSQSLLDYHIHYFSNLAQDKKCPLNFKTEQGDARFKAPEWEQQYIYKVIKDFYLL